MKKNLFSITLFCLLASLAQAQSGIALNLGTKGIGLDYAHKINTAFGVKAGLNFFRIEFEDRKFAVPQFPDQTVAGTGFLELNSIDLQADYAIKSNFRIFGGLNFAMAKNLFEADFASGSQDIELFGLDVFAPAGASTVFLKMEEKTPIHPFFGIAFGKLVPTKKVGFSGDIGTMYFAKPEITELRSSLPTDKELMQKGLDKDWTTLYAIINLRLTVRI